MALDKVTKISAHQRETSMEQQEEFLTDQGREASTEVASPRGAEIDRESLSCDSRDRETASNNSWRLKVAVVVALSGISYVFGLSHITETRVRSIESYAPILWSPCQSLERTKLSSLKTFSLSGLICRRI
jgi:hypothetical protein